MAADIRTVNDERVVWSVDLPEADDGHVLVGPDGHVIVSSRRFLAMIHPSGQPGWLVETDLGILSEPVLVANRLVRDEDGNLVTRDLATGSTLFSVGVPAVSGLAAGPGDDLLHSAWIPQRGPMLCRSAMDGPVRWATPLTEPFVTLVATEDQVVVADGPALCGYDLAGNQVWSADRGGFRDPRGPSAVAGQVHGRLQLLPDRRVLAELSEPDGHGFYLFDPGAQTVSRVTPSVGMRRPVAVVPHAGKARLAAVGPAAEIEAGRPGWSILLIETSGQVVWSHPVRAEPQALLPVGDGRVLVVCSPPLDRWKSYHHWYDLSGECLVRCLGDAGEQLWTWHAPIPLTYHPALGADGTTYVAGPGRLWALR